MNAAPTALASWLGHPADHKAARGREIAGPLPLMSMITTTARRFAFGRLLVPLVLVTECLGASARSRLPPLAFKGCGSVKSHGTRVFVAVLRGKPTCRTARRVLSAYLNSHRACGGSACVRRHFGWTCASRSADFPRVASCQRGALA